MVGLSQHEVRALTPAKRVFDLCLTLLLSPVAILLLAVLCPWLLLRQGRPIFHPSERMKGVDRPFTLWKLRTMRSDARDSGVTGGEKLGRITETGAWLRSLRFDELPQLWNILRGDMSFVGPRPPLREYVAAYPQLYGRILKNRPGLTGLATLVYHRREARLLSACRTPQETDAVYRTRCIPAKARLDLMYQRRRTLGLDLVLVLRSAQTVLPGKSRHSVTFQPLQSSIVSEKSSGALTSEAN